MGRGAAGHVAEIVVVFIITTTTVVVRGRGGGRRVEEGENVRRPGRRGDRRRGWHRPELVKGVHGRGRGGWGGGRGRAGGRGGPLDGLQKELDGSINASMSCSQSSDDGFRLKLRKHAHNILHVGIHG